jgi:hypothetical protein
MYREEPRKTMRKKLFKTRREKLMTKTVLLKAAVVKTIPLTT